MTEAKWYLDTIERIANQTEHVMQDIAETLPQERPEINEQISQSVNIPILTSKMGTEGEYVASYCRNRALVIQITYQSSTRQQ